MNVLLGIPKDRNPSDDYLMNEREFVLSYNPRLNEPNWVAWRLRASDLGHARRGDDFRPDPLLPAGMYHVVPGDYARSGYDRGHMCPSADRTRSTEENAVTFLMTNVEPQLHELNAGPWEKLEDYERAWALRATLYIVAGGVFEAQPPTIGHGVAVPAANFKIIVALPAGQGASDVTTTTPVLAVQMPNDVGVGEHDFLEYETSVDRIEEATGYDFLDRVPESISRVIEARGERH